MEAVILAGGMGKRLKSVVGDCPKPMAKVGGRPFLEWLVLALKSQGLKRVIFCIGCQSDIIQDYFKEGQEWGMEFIYSKENSFLGTGGALRLALPRVHSERFFVLNGDSYSGVNLKQMEDFHLSRQAQATVWLVRVANSDRYGCVAVGATGAVEAYLEKQASGSGQMINAGVYLMERASISKLPTGRPVSLETDFFPALIGNGLYAIAGPGPFIDIGTPEDYQKAQLFFKGELGQSLEGIRK